MFLITITCLNPQSCLHHQVILGLKIGKKILREHSLSMVTSDFCPTGGPFGDFHGVTRIFVGAT